MNTCVCAVICAEIPELIFNIGTEMFSIMFFSVCLQNPLKNQPQRDRSVKKLQMQRNDKYQLGTMRTMKISIGADFIFCP